MGQGQTANGPRMRMLACDVWTLEIGDLMEDEREDKCMAVYLR